MFTGRLQNPVVGRPRDQMTGHSGDVCRKLPKQVLKFNSQAH